VRRTTFNNGLRAWWYIVLLFLYGPLAIVVLFSFNSTRTYSSFKGFSLEWYAKLFANETIVNAIYNSMSLAIVSSTLATMLGAILGYGMYRYRHLNLGWLIWFIYLPLVMPDIVYGISQMTFFVTINEATGLLEPGLLTMIIAHISFQIPFVALLVYSRLLQLDPLLFEATQDLYATPWQRAWYFIIPTLQAALISSFFLSFTLSIDDFVISFFTAGPESTTLPIFIWSAIKKGITPEINAISTLMIGAVFTAAAISYAIQRAKPVSKPSQQ
jgi:spermidine/putrescine transport system permease protein